MVNQLINEINFALDNNLYLVALNTALTLPDICGKAEYTNEKSSKKRYIDWYDNYIGQYEINPHNTEHGINMPYLSGDVVYSLRCSLLHQGNPNIDKKQNINQFSLVIEKKNEFDIYADSASCGNNERTYKVNIRRLCCILCWTVEHYYNTNKEKFNFFNYSIIDIDEERKKIDNAYKRIDELLNRNTEGKN